MSNTKWTKDQQKVLRARKHNILVSAAAGSGKTAVLVERIIQMISDPDSGIEIDKLLVVTFTNAAAAEMKERIRKGLEERIDKEPDNLHLQTQLMLLQGAHISTIHGFCLYVIRNYFHVIDLDPAFRIGDENELAIMRNQVSKDVIEQKYVQGETEFLNMIESLTADKTDASLEELIIKLHSQAMAEPSFSFWKQKMLRPYEVTSVAELEKAEWMQGVLEGVKLRIADTLHLLKKNRMENVSVGEMDKFIQCFDKDIEVLEQMEKFETFSQFVEWKVLGEEIAFSRNPSVSKKDSEEIAEKKIKCQEIRKKYLTDKSNGILSLKEKYFSSSIEEVYEKMQSMYPVVKALLSLVETYHIEFAKAKREKGILDFNDQEHLALQILTEEKEGKLVPTGIAKELREQFLEIIIDEYQDSNEVQEQILTSVSTVDEGKPNIFMVGDVKQSIYRFRMAKPDLFNEKYNTYDTEEESLYQKIELQQNFRSRKTVIKNTNYIFKRIMHSYFGKIDYDEKAKLYEGLTFPRYELMEMNANRMDAAEVIVANKPKQVTSAEMEARMLAWRIKRLLQVEKMQVYENGAYRQATYRDIAILHRSPNKVSSIFKKILFEEGIPMYTESEEGYFMAEEVQFIMHLLRIIDNPRQDISLAAVLRSEVFEFTDEEIAKLAKEKRAGENLYDGLCRKGTQDEGEHAKQFLEKLNEYREMASYSTVLEVVQYILEDTFYAVRLAGQEGGERKLGNLQILKAKAKEFSVKQGADLFSFICYMDELIKLGKDFGEYSTEEETRDSICMMSIHKSKGLEFPIVIVAGMGRRFNLQDASAKVCIHTEIGMGMHFVDLDARTQEEMLIQKRIREMIKEESLAEELRVLYVALTRAREKLIITGVVKNATKVISDYEKESDFRNHMELGRASCFFDWILPALNRNKGYYQLISQAGLYRQMKEEIKESVTPDEVKFKNDTHLKMYMCTQEDLDFDKAVEEMEKRKKEEWLKTFDKKKTYDKALEVLVNEEIELREGLKEKELPVKISVSELKRMKEEKEEPSIYLVKEEPVPAFIKEDTPSGAEIGTLYHKVLEQLQYENLDKNKLQESLEKELLRQVNQGFIKQEEKEKIVKDKIYQFLDSVVGKEMWQAALQQKLYREQPFVVGIPVKDVYPEYKNAKERFLIQGIIDAYYETEEGLVVVDYKTDHIEEGKEWLLAEKYSLQLAHYIRALKMLTGKDVVRKYIYSLSLNKAILVEKNLDEII